MRSGGGFDQRLWGVMLGALWLLVPGLAVAAPSGDDNASACTQALTVQEWAPFVALAGGTPRTALPELARLVDFQRTAVAATQPDPRVAGLEHDLWQALRHFDLPTLYKTLPNEQSPWRSLDLRASLAGDQYRVQQVSPKASHVGAMGDSLAHIGMRPIPSAPDAPGGQHYEIRGSWQLGIGVLRWTSMRKTQWLGLDRLVEPRKIAAPRAALAAASGANPKLSLVDNPIAGQLVSAFPATAAWYAGIGRIDGLRGHGADIAGLEHLNLDLALDPGRLQDQYPAVADYLDHLGDVFSARVTIGNAQGQWLTFALDSKTRQLVIEAWLRDGHLVPTRHGLPVPNYRPGATLTEGQFESRATLRMRALGITVTLSNLPMRWRYSRDDQGAHFSGWLHDKPQVKVSGKALGLIPAGMMEGLLPVNVSDTVDDFLGPVAVSCETAPRPVLRQDEAQQEPRSYSTQARCNAVLP